MTMLTLDEQKALDAEQKRAGRHPVVCGKCRATLKAGAMHWYCPTDACTYTQGYCRNELDLIIGEPKPSHYAKCAIDPWTYAMRNSLDALQFSVVKYVTRFRDKGGIEDLRKCRDSLDRLIAFEEAK